jgi:hypothetical protein
VRKSLPWILLLLLGGCLLLGFLAADRWLAGEKFHAFLEQKSSVALNATASFGPLEWGWLELSSPKFHAEGGVDTSLRKLEAAGLHGRLNAMDLLRGLWHIELITLENATIRIDSARHPKNPDSGIHKQLEVKPGLQLPGWFPSLLVIDVIRSDKTDITIDLPSGAAIDIHGTRLDAHPEGHETRFEALGGTIKSPFLPDQHIDYIRCRMKPDLVDLTGAKLTFPTGGSLELEGNFPDAKASFLTGHWEKVPLAIIIPTLANRIAGTLEGNATISWDLAGLHTMQGNIKAHEVTLTGFPMLDAAARFSGIEQFRNLPIQQAQASFSSKGGVTEWHDVILESKGMMKLIGSGNVVAGGAVNGSFWLGLPAGIVAKLPGAMQVFSGDEQDGFLWTSLQVGGSLSYPTEDLTQRLSAAALGSAAATVLHGVQELVKPLTGAAPAGTNNPVSNVLSNPTAPAKAALDILGGFLK